VSLVTDDCDFNVAGC